jgi:tryptophan synthase alpha chain
MLVTPTSSAERIAAIDEASRGFVYCVSSTGVTGQQGKNSSREYIQHVRSLVRRNPLLVGFGVSSPESAAEFARDSDGVIIGSALIRRLGESVEPTELVAWIKTIKATLKNGS